MDGLICDIFNIFESQIDIWRAFLKISKKKTDIIKSNSIYELDKLTKAEEALLMRFAVLESKRYKALVMFGAEHSLETEISSDKIKNYLSEKDIERYDLLSERFSSVLDEQDKYNKVNENLIRVKLEYVNHIFDAIDEGRKKEVYSMRKSNTTRMKNGIIDKRA